MTAYNKAPAGTAIEVADGTFLPVDEFRTVEVDLEQPGTTTKPVKMVAAAYVPGLLRYLLYTRKAVEQWGDRSSTTKRRLFWSSRGRSRLFLTSALAKDCFLQQVRDGPE